MFGYVNADKPNMLIKDYAVYRAYYCGLCKSIGRKNPPLMRFTINYDITFLTMLAHNYNKVEPKFKKALCIAHPVGKPFSVVVNDPVQECVVDINTILGYYKAYDDIADRGSLKHRIAKLYIKGKYKRAAKRYHELDKALKNCFKELYELEKADSRDIDATSKTSGDMLVAVAKACCPTYDDLLITLADNLGRWIYLIDAYDDLLKDVKKGNYNPLKVDGELTDEVLDGIQKVVREKLYFYLGNIKRAYDQMDITITEGPLSNVVYVGLRTRTEEVLETRGVKCKKTLL